MQSLERGTPWSLRSLDRGMRTAWLSAPRSKVGVVLERAYRGAEVVRHRRGTSRGVVDQDERLLRGRHERVVGQAVRGALVRDARPSDPGHPDERLDQVVEASRSVVLDGGCPHDELEA